jgi:hypothetical protein
MNDNTEQLTETFAAHEHLAPDAEEVLARVKGIARSYQRRRWAVRATGGAVLGVGLVAGGIALPGRAGHAGSGESITTPLADGGDPTPTPTASSPSYTQDEEWSAYFAAGYDYNDAVQLAQLWNDSSSIGQVKAEAGLDLLDGQTLPVQPSGTPETPSEKAQSAFFAAGYDSNDAVTLSKMWHDSDLMQVKTEAGQKLIDGQPLPIQPSGPSVSSVEVPPAGSGSSRAERKMLVVRARQLNGKSRGVVQIASTPQDSDVQAFFAAGYTYNDAVKLGNIWHESDTFRVKAEAGHKLVDGKALPVQPSGTPETQSEKAQNAYFTAGYDYADAVKLGKMWHESDLNQVKIEAGQKLLHGQKLPIAP